MPTQIKPVSTTLKFNSQQIRELLAEAVGVKPEQALIRFDIQNRSGLQELQGVDVTVNGSLVEKVLQLAAEKPSKKAAKPTDKEEVLEEVFTLLSKIRFQNWPTEGLGIGLDPAEIDALFVKIDTPAKRRNL